MMYTFIVCAEDVAGLTAEAIDSGGGFSIFTLPMHPMHPVYHWSKSYVYHIQSQLARW